MSLVSPPYFSNGSGFRVPKFSGIKIFRVHFGHFLYQPGHIFNYPKSETFGYQNFRAFQSVSESRNSVYLQSYRNFSKCERIAKFGLFTELQKIFKVWANRETRSIYRVTANFSTTRNPKLSGIKIFGHFKVWANREIRSIYGVT